MLGVVEGRAVESPVVATAAVVIRSVILQSRGTHAQLGSGALGLKLTGLSEPISMTFLNASTMKMTAMSVAKLSSVNRVMYLTKALRLKMTMIKMKPTVHIPTQNRIGMKSQSLSLKSSVGLFKVTCWIVLLTGT